MHLFFLNSYICAFLSSKTHPLPPQPLPSPALPPNPPAPYLRRSLAMPKSMRHHFRWPAMPMAAQAGPGVPWPVPNMPVGVAVPVLLGVAVLLGAKAVFVAVGCWQVSVSPEQRLLGLLMRLILACPMMLVGLRSQCTRPLVLPRGCRGRGPGGKIRSGGKALNRSAYPILVCSSERSGT